MRISDWSSDVCSSDLIFAWLEGVAAAGEDMLIGFDFSAAFAFADAGAYFPQWSETPVDIRALWALVERLARGDPHYEAGAFLAPPDARPHFPPGPGEGGHLFPPGSVPPPLLQTY